MAFVPDEAIMRAMEVSPKAFMLFVTYCKFRNHETGIAWPGSAALCTQLQIKKAALSKLRQELMRAGWIEANGNVINFKLNFNQLPISENLDPENLDFEVSTTETKFPPRKQSFHHGNKVSTTETLISENQSASFHHGNKVSTTETLIRKSPENSNQSFRGGNFVSVQETTLRKNHVLREREREGSARSLSLVEQFSETEKTLAQICDLHPDTLTDKQIFSVTDTARRLEAARGFDVALLARWPDFWNNYLRKSSVPSKPEYVLEHFGKFLSWAKGAAA